MFKRISLFFASLVSTLVSLGGMVYAATLDLETVTTGLKGIGIPADVFMSTSNLLWYFVVPLLIVFVILYGILIEINIFTRNPKMNVALAVLFTLTTLPLGWFAVFINYIVTGGVIILVVPAIVGIVLLGFGLVKGRLFEPGLKGAYWGAKTRKMAALEEETKDVTERIKKTKREIDDLTDKIKKDGKELGAKKELLTEIEAGRAKGKISSVRLDITNLDASIERNKDAREKLEIQLQGLEKEKREKATEEVAEIYKK